MAKGITIGALRQWLVSAAENDSNKDDLEVILRITDEDGTTKVCGLHDLAVEAGCTETEALMLDGHIGEDEEEGDDDG